MRILKRLNTSLHRFYYRNFSKSNWKVVRRMNAEFVMRPSNYIDRRMWVEGGYEKQQIQYLLDQSKRAQFDAFLDIGANFGLYTCILGAHKAVPVCHSFECDPRNVYHLYGHVRMNDLMGIVNVHQVAVGDEEKTVKFRTASEESTGHSHAGESRLELRV